jgi:hypothetical protein
VVLASLIAPLERYRMGFPLNLNWIIGLQVYMTAMGGGMGSPKSLLLLATGMGSVHWKMLA